MTPEEIDALRYKAFETNSEQDRVAYLQATSRYFQDRHQRNIITETRIAELEAELARVREALTKIAQSYIGDCPAAVPEENFLRECFQNIREIARTALKGQTHD